MKLLFDWKGSHFFFSNKSDFWEIRTALYLNFTWGSVSRSLEDSRALGERAGLGSLSLFALVVALSWSVKTLSAANSGLSRITGGSTDRVWRDSDFGLSTFFGVLECCCGQSLPDWSVFLSPMRNGQVSRALLTTLFLSVSNKTFELNYR